MTFLGKRKRRKAKKPKKENRELSSRLLKAEKAKAKINFVCTSYSFFDCLIIKLDRKIESEEIIYEEKSKDKDVK